MESKTNVHTPSSIPPPPPPPPLPPPPQSTQREKQQYETPAVEMMQSAAAASDEEEGLKQIIATIASKLEYERNHQTELEAWILLTSSQLQHAQVGGTTSSSNNSGGGSGSSSGRNAHITHVELTNDVPPTIVDAWQHIANAATRATTLSDNLPVVRDNNKVQHSTTAWIVGMENPDQQQQTHIVTIPGGQQSVAIQKVILNNSYKRLAAMASESVQQQAIGKDLLQQLMQQCQSTTTTNAITTGADPWLQLLDTKLHEIRKYHTEHNTTFESIASNDNTITGTSTNPVIAGYDMIGTIQRWTSSTLLDTLYTTEEVMGKYLDLHVHYDSFVQQLSHLINNRKKNNNNAPTIKATTVVNEENDNPNNIGKKRSIQNVSSSSPSLSSSYQYIDFLHDLTKGIGQVWMEEQKLHHRKKYNRFLLELQQYIVSFLQRTVPLINIQELIQTATDTFQSIWSRSGGYIGWQEKALEADLVSTIGALTNRNNETIKDDAVNSNSNETIDTTKSKIDESLPKIDLTLYETANELAAKVDADTLKIELSRLGLKCGGTVQDRAARLFLLKTTRLEDLQPKLFAKMTEKNAIRGTANPNVTTNTEESQSNPNTSLVSDSVDAAAQHGKHERRIDIAYREAIVTALLGQVGPTLEATIRRTERRQTQTLKEREFEMDEELYGGGIVLPNKENKGEVGDGNVDSDEEDAPIYNPKNVPLDFDGKPIPYWLFKLHGLNHYYPCEICGGEAYRGRRIFELHFGEPRHAAGMRALGIPNTKHFHGVTSIEDAQILWQSLQDKMQQNKFDERNDEEYEDSHGNVLSRNAYEELARQNLL